MTSRTALITVALASAIATGGCSSSDSSAPPTTAEGGAGAGGSLGGGGSAAGGASGASGSGASGKGGSSATGGNAGHSGTAGAGQGGTGAAGSSNGVGGAHGGGAGMSGGSGASGSSGSAGASGAAGAAGKGGCATDADCQASAPTTTPPSCAVGTCDTSAKTCSYKSIDADKDGHGTSKCKASDGTPIVVGDDCDDTDPNTFTGAWDGPMGDGEPNRCDGIDEDCDGTPDDGHLANGTTCTCSPNDVRNCSEDSNGKPITWPTGMPAGTCKYGSQTCSKDGSWGPCTNAIVPVQESCNMLDDDCNGIIDDGPAPDHVPVDAVYFAYDGDDDLHARVPGSGYQPVHACSFNVPTSAPTACTQGSFANCTLGKTAAECCPPGNWKFAQSIPANDCNDEDSDAYPGGMEICINGLDDNCDGKVDENCVCQPGTKNTSCATTTSGTMITFPGGMPDGACKYGTATCSSDGTSWGTCLGAIGPAAMDDCSGAVGVDSNCDGMIECPCTPLDSTQSCANQNGSCKGAIQSCTPTGWGACSIKPAAFDTCDAGNDDNCNGTVNDGCSAINGQACGAVSTCNVGVYKDCTPQGSCTCTGGSPQSKITYCWDGDGDKYCDFSHSTIDECPGDPPPAGAWVAENTVACTSQTMCNDCNDANANINPGEVDKCDGGDQNCDGVVNTSPPCSCQNGETYQCGDVNKCNQGATYGCNNGMPTACSVAPSSNAGTACKLGGLGLCNQPDSGVYTCNDGTDGTTYCGEFGGDQFSPGTIGPDAEGEPNPWEATGSFDYNCDGAETPVFNVVAINRADKCTTAYYASVCASLPSNKCGLVNTFVYCYPVGTMPVPTSAPCGAPLVQIQCDGSSPCVFDGLGLTPNPQQWCK